MTRRLWHRRGPALVLAGGILISTAAAVLTSGSPWTVAAGPLLFAAAVLGADVLGRRAESSAPSREALVLAAAFLVACGTIALADPRLLPAVIPVLGGSAVSMVPLSTAPRGCRSGAL